MQNSQLKKKSLFSQRAKQIRQKQPANEEHSFPKAIKIEMNNEIKNDVEQKKMKENIQQKRFIDLLLKSQLKEEQISSIQNDNLNSIKNMNEEEIRKHQQMIMKQMPKQFLEKFLLKKGRINVTNQNSFKKNKKEEEKRNNQLQQQQQKQNEQNQQLQDEKCNQGTLSRLCIDIKQMVIKIWRQQFLSGNQDIISMSSLKLMIQSQNNQTQIIGSKLLLDFCNLLKQKLTKNKEAQVFRVEGEWFHLPMLIEDVYKYLLISLMNRIKRTNFKSCWIQMMDNLLKTIKIIKRELLKIKNGQLLETTINFLKSQLPKLQIFGLCQKNGKQNQMRDEQQVQSIQNLGNLIKILGSKQSAQKFTSIQFMNLTRDHPLQTIEQLKIQLFQLAQNNQYHFTSLLQRICYQAELEFKDRQQHKKEYLVDLVYGLALELLRLDNKSNRMSHQFDIVKQSMYSWLCSVLDCKYLLPNLSYLKSFRNQNQQSLVFKCLMITKILSYRSYTQFLAPQSANTNDDQMVDQVHIQNQRLAIIITYLNIQEYFSPKTKILTNQQKQADIESITKMLLCIDFKTSQKSDNYIKQIADLVLIDLISIFLSDQKGPSSNKQKETIQLTFNDFPETTLEATIAHLCDIIITRKLESKVWESLPQQKIKSLISSYNYNSFGNYTFTKLLLFLIVCCPHKNIQAMIIQEVMSRYPFLFFYAAQDGLYGPISLYLSRPPLEELQEIYNILTAVKKIDESNMFVRYLLKK